MWCNLFGAMHSRTAAVGNSDRRGPLEIARAPVGPSKSTNGAPAARALGLRPGCARARRTAGSAGHSPRPRPSLDGSWVCSRMRAPLRWRLPKYLLSACIRQAPDGVEGRYLCGRAPAPVVPALEDWNGAATDARHTGCLASAAEPVVLLTLMRALPSSCNSSATEGGWASRADSARGNGACKTSANRLCP